MNVDSVKLKGNASFVIREGWLSKGLRHVKENPAAFQGEKAIQTFGLGSAMVQSLRHWMQAAGLTTEERPAKSRQRTQKLTQLGALIAARDPYFEDVFSYCLVHYRIATSEELATVWYLLFNVWDVRQFTRERMTEDLLEIFRGMAGEKKFAERSFQADCATALRTYVSDGGNQTSPEDNMQCPLADLGLFTRRARDRYERTAPPPSRLHRYAVLYVLLDRMGQRKQVSIQDLLQEPCNVGRIFHLDSYRLNTCLDELQADGLLTVQRTAGLNMVQPSAGLDAQEAAVRYYEER